MGDYFKPWRRKIGVVTLVIACACAAGWASSYSGLMGISVGGKSLYCSDGVLRFYLPDPARYTTVEVFSAPCWTIVIPLMLFSAWLLLSRPRGRKPPPPV